MRFWITFLLFLLGSGSVFGTEVTGRLESNTGQAIPLASVYIAQSKYNTVTDDSGRFILNLPSGNYTINFYAVGFLNDSLSIQIGLQKMEISFQLKERSLTPALPVQGEDPGFTLMRKVIQLKRFNESRIRTFETQIYRVGSMTTQKINKISALNVRDPDIGNLKLEETKSGILYLMESFSNYKIWSSKRKLEDYEGYRELGNPQGLEVKNVASYLDMYQNKVDLLGLRHAGFISPASDDAFQYYNFRLVGSFRQNGKLIYKIEVAPIKEFSPLFNGYVYVLDKDWTFVKVDLFLDNTSQISGLESLKFHQEFREISNGRPPVIQGQSIKLEIRVLGTKVKGRFLTGFINQSVNYDFTPPDVSKRINILYDAKAKEQREDYWQKVRIFPIDSVELKDFRYKDSVLLARQIKKDSTQDDVHYHLSALDLFFGNPRIVHKRNEWYMRPLVMAVQFNSVEGISGTLDLGWKHTFGQDMNKSLDFRVMNRYATYNHHYNGLGIVRWQSFKPSWPQKQFTAELTGGRYVYQINGNNPIVPIVNELYTLLRGHNYMKLYQNQLIALSVNQDFGNGLTLAASLSYEKRLELENGTNFSFISRHNERISPNIPNGLSMMEKQRAIIASFTMSWQPGVRYVFHPEYKEAVFRNTPIFTIDYTQGIPNHKATADFGKWRFSIRHEIPFRSNGYLDYQIGLAGFIWAKEVNLPDWNHIRGYRTFLATPYLNSFQLADNYRYSNIAKVYEELHLEWHLNGLLMRHLPLLKRTNVFLVTGTNLLYVGHKDYYAEAFLGIENLGWGLMRYGRLDFLVGFNPDNSKALYGVRLGLYGLWKALLNTRTVRNL